MATKPKTEPIGLLGKLDADAQETAQRELDQEAIREKQWARYRDLIHRHDQLTATEAAAAANAGDAVGLKPADLAAHCKLVDRWRTCAERSNDRDAAAQQLREAHQEKAETLKRHARELRDLKKKTSSANTRLARAGYADRELDEMRRQYPNLFGEVAASS